MTKPGTARQLVMLRVHKSFWQDGMMPAQDLATLRAVRTTLHRCYRCHAPRCALGDTLMTAEAITLLPDSA